jgi:hypothetical protein
MECIGLESGADGSQPLFVARLRSEKSDKEIGVVTSKK